MDAVVERRAITLNWPDALTIIREFGTKTMQTSVGFRFSPEGDAIERIRDFSDGFRKARASQGALKKELDQGEIQQRLIDAGFTRRKLKEFQLRDLENLIALPNGANFSVPGAGKTTVTFALHTLTRRPGSHLLI